MNHSESTSHARADPSPHAVRHRLGIRGELMLALPPTATILVVLTLVETLSTQRLLFASLASSAFAEFITYSGSYRAIRAPNRLAATAEVNAPLQSLFSASDGRARF